MLVRSEKLSQILLHDDLVNHAHDDLATAAEVVESKCNSSGKEEKVVCA